MSNSRARTFGDHDLHVGDYVATVNASVANRKVSVALAKGLDGLEDSSAGVVHDLAMADDLSVPQQRWDL